MTNKIIKTIFFVVSIGRTVDNFSQTSTVFFSITGDTVCYSGIFGQSVDSSHTAYTTYIKYRDKSKVAQTLSSFDLICTGATDKCIETLNKDSIKKYNLQLDGKETSPWTNKDFNISVKPTNTRIIDTSAFGPKFIYQTTVIAVLSCKGSKLYAKTFDVMFKGNSPDDFPSRDFFRVKAWHKKNTKKYLVDISVKEHQTFKKPTDTPDYSFNSIMFIL